MKLPTETFANLSESKRKRIFDAAVQEFAARRFSEASINQIIKGAGISRGSFYQYFADKEDLYLYVLSEIGREKMSVAFAQLPPKDADFFATYMHMVESLIIWAREQPLYCKIGVLMDMDDSEFIAKLIARVPDAWGALRDLIERDKKLGRIKPEIDSDLVIQMLYNQNIHFIKEFYRTWSEENLLRQVEEMIKIYRGGIAIV